ncbi:MAG: crotonase [Planctomycetota bacterium]|nr:MAG: crotonase [Planctomycetota bacterium]
MEFEHLELHEMAPGIANLMIQRPKVLNALNSEVLDELALAMEALAADPEIKVIVLSGGGEKAFVAGADIAEMAEFEALEARDFSRLGQATLNMVEDCPKPVIAMIQGFALGGGLELALACHLRVASTKARLGLPEVGLGLLPGFGGTQRLSRLAGPGLAREWILTGDHFSAEEAHRVGVVNRLVEPEKLTEATVALAKTLASRGPVAMQLALECIRRGQEGSQSEGEASEADAFGMVFTTRDMREGTKAFMEKRKADFQGR